MVSSSAKRRAPELEGNFNRSPSLGYEPTNGAGLIRCLAHGFPTPLARWHCHEEYELHLITTTSGKAFVGDWIGAFSPGHLVLCGPNLPHNWMSSDLPKEGVSERDLVIQFAHTPIEKASLMIPELRDILPLLERSRHGIEFLGFTKAEGHWHRVKTAKGLVRLTAFLEWMDALAHWRDYRLLSQVHVQGPQNDAESEQINEVVNQMIENASNAMKAAEVARALGMSESRFSRFFRRTTGNTYTDFVNQLRIHHACQLLMNTDRYVNTICYDVGFNNVANFNRRFREIKGMSPSEFRAQVDKRFGDRLL